MRQLHLPSAPPAQEKDPVRAWREPVVIPTYEPAPPDRNPMFLERRVYQGSSGKVYPLPFYDRIADTKVDRAWDAVHLENEYLRVMILPELGGRIHAVRDKTNAYDLVYRQDVIKPALVGLAGPWVSGGIELNWPQHHRPATFMPTDVHVEAHADGGRTVWLSDHDPMSRMKGMHGVHLRPGRAYVELRVRLYNRTPLPQTFLWWANVATEVHERYQSFFPPDVYYVADHAKRAMSRFPRCDGRYYGVDYGRRGREGVPAQERPRQFAPPEGMYSPDDLSWYANIPVPTSYMCMGTGEDFFGGYDHAAEAGIVHFASHHVSPGKKQWTWGNHEFGYAWDRNLTDPDERGVYRPYIELMAGVFTDNQPDFSFLAPGETRTFSQYWYPIRKIGPAQAATLEAAASLRVDNGLVRVGVATTAVREGVRVTVAAAGKTVAEWSADVAPDRPFVAEAPVTGAVGETDLELTVRDREGRELVRYRPTAREPNEVPAAATEPPKPGDVLSADELYVTGLHLEQYRHATRRPEEYWREALRRDPLDARGNNAMGLWHLRRGEFDEAEGHFRRAVERLTRRNPNPYDGEPYYNLGLALRHLGREDEAYGAFHKAAWNAAWQGPAYLAIAEIDCRRGDWAAALGHLDLSLRRDVENLWARDLKAVVLRRLGREGEAAALVRETLSLDPLDWMARHLDGQAIACDAQTRLDLALDLARAGLLGTAAEFLEGAAPEPASGTAPLVEYYLGYVYERMRQGERSARSYARGAAASPDYCFPARLEEIGILLSAIRANPSDARAHYYLGNLYFDRRRHREAIALWERAAELDPAFPTAWRNLGIGYFNVLRDADKALAAYDRAAGADPGDARLLFERDQLRKRLGHAPQDRLAVLGEHLDLVRQRDDLSVELCALYNQVGRHERALDLLTSRRFQPWEGGEGLALGQHVRTHLAVGRVALAAGDARGAVDHFEAALRSPENLGEARHLLANQSDVHYWLGAAYDAAGDAAAARRHWTVAAEASGDFQEMSVRPYSEMTYYGALALGRLGRPEEARALLEGLLGYAEALLATPARVDYFATSLPTLLLFEDDLDRRQRTHATLLKGQALLGLGERGRGRELLRAVLEADPGHAAASDLLAETDPPPAIGPANGGASRRKST